MEVLYIVCFFIIGLVFGSFFCCVGLRLSTNKKFINDRSVCDNCRQVLSWYDLIPLVSYISLKGRCRYCHKKVSLLNPFIELVTGILFALSYYSFGFSVDLVLALSIIALTMIIFASDLTYMIIPDEVIIFFSIVIIILEFFLEGITGVGLSLLSGLSLFFFMYCLMKLGNALFKKESLGGGDVKLFFVLGLVIDPFLGLVTIFLASLIALPVSLYLLYKNKEHMIPFGPFILIAFLIVFFSKITTSEIFEFLTLF